jgi:membrane-bound lytic murein transglycosylase A
MHRLLLRYFLLATLIISGCFSQQPADIAVAPKLKPDAVSSDLSSPYNKTGKIFPPVQFKQVYLTQTLDTFPLPVIDNSIVNAIQNNLRLLKSKRRRNELKAGNLVFDQDDLEYVSKLLLENEYTYPADLSQYLDAHQIKGRDGRGNVYFTGYYTPVLEAKRDADEKFKYPIYRYPDNWVGPLPSRRQIDGEKALEGRDLEIAYTEKLEDIYFMQVQGSGFVEYPDGSKHYLGFDGTNRKPYRSIGRFLMKSGFLEKGASISMDGIKSFLKENPQYRDTVLFHNPSYTFFNDKGEKPLGAGTVPLTAGISIAVDERYIPLGSILLASVPVINSKGRVIRHELKFLIAQDVGGQINGPGHIDYYCGIGARGRELANKHHHYGRLWLLLPKKQT